MTTVTDFQTLTKQNFLDFLNSALVVDEEATYYESSRFPQKLVTPGRGSRVEKNEDENDETVASRNHKLFCGEIIEAFAEKGIVCGVFRPVNGSGWTKRVIKAASNADIVILDWNLKVKDAETAIDETAANAGSHALNIIKNLAEKDLKSGRIRMIAIYTAEIISDKHLLAPIKAELRNITDTQGRVNIRQNGNVISAGPLTVAVIRKTGSSSEDRYNESELPDRLLDILVRQYSGLLMNAANSVAMAVRNNMYQLLNLYSSQLDAAYVAHRIGLETPEEAEEHFLHVMLSDFQEILESANVTNNLNTDALLFWAEDMNARKALKDEFFGTTFSDAKETFRLLLTSGFPQFDRLVKCGEIKNLGLDTKAREWAQQKRGTKGKRLSEVSSQFTSDGNHDNSNRLWVKRTTIRNHYEEPIPFLRPGTILQTRKNRQKEFLICVQQECDCRRIKQEGREFIFLPAKLVEKDKTNSGNIFLKLGNEWQEWTISNKGYELRKIHFKPSKQTM